VRTLGGRVIRLRNTDRAEASGDNVLLPVDNLLLDADGKVSVSI
jgi:hypothetical protein